MNDLIAQIKELEYDAERELQALRNIVFDNKSAIFYDLVLIRYLDNNNTKKFNVCKWNATKNLRNLMRMLFKNNVFYKNIAKKENVYFAVTSKTKLLNFIWLDDIKLENIDGKQLDFLTLIETSEGNYQAWIKLDKLYAEQKIQLIKKYLVEKLKADRAATAKIQPMRLPGFYSHKREIPFFVKTYRTAERELPGEKILAKISKENKKTIIVNNSLPSRNEIKTGNFLKYSYYKRKIGEQDILFDPLDERDAIVRWAEKEGHEVDENIIDINYVYQLLIRGYKKSEIFNYLCKVRNDIDIKHKAANYFERTYLKAQIFRALHPDKFLYENRVISEILKENNGEKVTEFLQKYLQKLQS
jgi:hypothetical protein